MTENTIALMDLLLDNGELVRIEYPTEHQDGFEELVGNCIKRKDSLSMQTFAGCNAEYLGISISTIITSRIVGIL